MTFGHYAAIERGTHKFAPFRGAQGENRPRLSLASARSGWPPPRGLARHLASLGIAPAFDSLCDTHMCIALGAQGENRTLMDCSARF